MTAAIMFLSGLTAAIAGALLRSCGTGVEAELMRHWCGPQSPLMAVQAHAHCAGCASLAIGLVMMIASIVVAASSRSRVARERA